MMSASDSEEHWMDTTPISRFVTDNHGDQQSLWYEDGSIVLQAESTVFLAYRGLLASHSSVFADLFSELQSTKQEFFDSKPLVHIPDSALDVYYFLWALHDHVAFSASLLCNEFAVIAALLRLGTKYEVAHLRAHAINALSLYYPTSLAAHERRQDWDKADPNIDDIDFRCVNLLRETRVYTLLPAAFLECSAVGVSELERGINGGAVLDNSVDENIVASLKINMQYLEAFIDHQILKGADGCSSVICCRAKVKYALHATPNHFEFGTDIFPQIPFDPRRYGKKWSRDANLWEGWCEECYSAAFNRAAEARENAWNDLPVKIGLGSWEELLEPDGES